jgi:hypothetical protein
MLCVGIGKMLQAKYGPHFGDQSKYLSMGILNFVLETPPGNEEAERYCEANRCLIGQQANAIHLDFEFAYLHMRVGHAVLISRCNRSIQRGSRRGHHCNRPGLPRCSDVC